MSFFLWLVKHVLQFLGVSGSPLMFIFLHLQVDLEKICLVYDTFLSHYPLCYGYWKKYANHMANLCTINRVVEVYERALEFATYSVHLWVDYCTFGMLLFEDPNDVRR